MAQVVKVNVDEPERTRRGQELALNPCAFLLQRELAPGVHGDAGMNRHDSGLAVFRVLEHEHGGAVGRLDVHGAKYLGEAHSGIERHEHGRPRVAWTHAAGNAQHGGALEIYLALVPNLGNEHALAGVPVAHGVRFPRIPARGTNERDSLPDGRRRERIRLAVLVDPGERVAGVFSGNVGKFAERPADVIGENLGEILADRFRRLERRHPFG